MCIPQAWGWPQSPLGYVEDACTVDVAALTSMEQQGIAVVVGEWSLATGECRICFYTVFLLLLSLMMLLLLLSLMLRQTIVPCGSMA